MSKRFIVNVSDIILKSEEIIVLQGEVLQHLKALRKDVKDIVQVNEYTLELQEIHKDNIVAKIISVSDKKNENTIKLNVYQGYLKSDKMEYVVQKSVELGANSITGIITQNTVVRLEEKDRVKKQDRLQKIAIAAVEQCGRQDIPEIGNIVDIKELELDEDVVILCHEKSITDIKYIVKDISPNVQSVAMLIGPEGGFSDRDIEYIKSKNSNVKDVSLGQRILRAETACIYILSILGYELGI